jgi:prophage tail gpP-like protein
MSFELIEIVAEGMRYAGWKSVSVRAALNEAARSFDVEVSEVGEDWGTSPFATWRFPPNTPVEVLASGNLLVSGYVDDYSPSGDAMSHDIRIAGRGRGADFVDCSCVHPTGRFEEATVEEIAQGLDAFGVGIRMEVEPGPPVPWFQVRQGSSPHSEMMRLLAQRQLTMKGAADGSIVITRAGEKRHGGGLIQGENILSMSATLSARDRFSEYIVKGQSAVGTSAKRDLQVEARAIDPTVPRYRPKVLVDQADTDRTRAETRANWERKRASGHSAKADITVPGFRDRDGTLWEPGQLVFVLAGWLKIHAEMLIEAVEFSQDDRGGTTSRLTLIDPRTYAEENASEKKAPAKTGAADESGDEWWIF